MNIHYNQSWYGEKAEVIKKNQNYFVINYGCKGKGIVSNYNLFDGISCCFLDFDTEEVMPSQKFNPDIISIVHCHTGRYECEFSNHQIFYLSEGYFSIMGTKYLPISFSFPLKKCYAFSLVIDKHAINQNTKNILSDLLKRSPNNYDQYAGTVQGILDEIKEKGDEALFAYTEKFDKCKLTKDTIQVTEEEIKAAYEKVDDSLVEVIRKSLVNIREYHEKQKRNSWFDAKPDGTILGQKMTALASVGVYVPGGKAAYPSSVLMNIVPAKVAGVEKIVMVTPPNKEGEVTPATLVAANEAGATHIYKVGGAQAIGALAYGTESIEKVDKIVGPGNIYVALAKKAVYGHVSIDSIAGPSEILVLADDTANPHFVAADLLSQAEHDELASAILVTTSKTLGEKVQEEIEGYLKKLSRAEIIEKSLENFGYILEAETLDEALEVVNAIASEHLEIVTANPFEVMTKVRNAGAIFIGEYSSEPLGDYFAGPNHVLPTNGTAKFFSPLNVDDFVKKSSIIYYSKDALKAIHKDIETFAQAEGLTAHANSIAVRFEEE